LNSKNNASEHGKIRFVFTPQQTALGIEIPHVLRFVREIAYPCDNFVASGPLSNTPAHFARCRAAASIRPDENQRFQEAEWPKGLICYLHHEAGVWHVLANRRRVIMRSDDKADREAWSSGSMCSQLRAIINYQRITRWIKITARRGSARDFAYDTVTLVLSNQVSSRCLVSSQPFTSPFYSRSVLINRLFMFNAAWYSEPKVFEALRRRTRRLRQESVGGDTETSNKRMLLHRGDASNQSKKKGNCGIASTHAVSDRSFTDCLEDESPNTVVFRTCAKTSVDNARFATPIRSPSSFGEHCRVSKVLASPEVTERERPR